MVDTNVAANTLVANWDDHDNDDLYLPAWDPTENISHGGHYDNGQAVSPKGEKNLPSS